MFRIENPLDPGKDGQNPLIDGIRYHIRNSENIKEEILSNIDNYIIHYFNYIGYPKKASDILDYVLQNLGYVADDLIIADEHEILNCINLKICKD